MKVATFNINNINKRLPNLLRWLKRSKPDAVCLQELKCAPEDFPKAELERAGYAAVWSGQKTWNGVAILSRGEKPIITTPRLPGDPSDKQARYIEAAVQGIVIGCIYLPNGNPQPGPKFEYKMTWFARLARRATKLQKQGHPTILAGDFNVAPTDLDIYPTTSWDNDALIQPAPRKAFRNLIRAGWTDAIRELYGEERVYSFWTYWRNRYERDDGLRLDHLLLDGSTATRLLEGGVDADVRGEKEASDHAPVWIRLK
ncbi:exodeoxyribonuclease III [Bradyrhizobiaceae bacterium SG-6C]|nr:exodeoxyribonuclease III [Bradyrhizobiaceae bacterium SG-6C]